MKLTIKGRRTFSIDYPSLNCGGRWKLLNIIGSKARFREELDRGQDKCTDHGLVVLERVNRRQLLYWYSLQDSNQITASAVLNRKKPAGNH
jgi:hypothetical protein